MATCDSRICSTRFVRYTCNHVRTFCHLVPSLRFFLFTDDVPCLDRCPRRFLCGSTSTSCFHLLDLICFWVFGPKLVSASFPPECKDSEIAGLSPESPIQSVASFKVSAIRSSVRKINVTAVVIPRVTCDLSLHPIPFDSRWNHLTDIELADPGFGHTGTIDILLGVDVFIEVLQYDRCHKFGGPRENGDPRSPFYR